MQELDNVGQATYSNMVALKIGNKPMEISLQPNPGKGYFNVHLKGADGQAKMSVLLVREDWWL